MCGSSKVSPPPIPPPPPIIIPPEVAQKEEMVPVAGKVDPITKEYISRQAGISKLRIKSASKETEE